MAVESRTAFRELPPLRRIDTLDDAWREGNAATRLREVLRAAPALKDRIAASGRARRVRTLPIATFPYPSLFALCGGALSPAPYVMMTNRMQLVEADSEGGTIRILVNPSDPKRNQETPFFRR